jgi:hypothetical protein
MNRSRTITVVSIVSAILFSLNFISAGGTGPGALFDLSRGARERALSQAGFRFTGGLVDLSLKPQTNSNKRKTELSSFYSRPFEKYSHYSFGLNTNHFSLSYTGLGAGNIIERDLYGDPTGNSFSFSRHGAVVSVKEKIGNTGIGVSWKGYYDPGRTSKFIYSFSPGIAYYQAPVSFRAALPNLISTDSGSSSEAPTNFSRKVSIGAGIVTDALRIGVDLKKDLKSDGSKTNFYRAGVEWWPEKYLALRGGINSQGEKSFGFGIQGGNITINYAHTIHDELPQSYAVSLRWVFD